MARITGINNIVTLVLVTWSACDRFFKWSDLATHLGHLVLVLLVKVEKVKMEQYLYNNVRSK